ncbi:MAG: bifunctional phosphoribosylaminoimidazolecarboxamide formyltransferase/IMP cyclohydrolase [Acidimicrobiaceae bacterium]|nr:bifunctional phosphoribosylaminoimidazolecarboxamide formyltransferase/IMP cyclohydrolase [Acidimicrobiaceae bacterium]
MTRALLSVYDKTGIVEFARELHALGWELISSGGTATTISAAGIPVTDVAKITGYPAILGHRVVTLHPAIHGALLGDLSDASHVAEMQRLDIKPISLAVINLYPFSSNPSIELIDVGGPAMVRAAAKNHAHVAVVTDPVQYIEVLEALKSTNAIDAAMRKSLAARAFAMTAAYDAQVANWFADETVTLPKRINLSLVREDTLRYGENPHQQGARYRVEGKKSWWSSAKQLGGKEMSYLNVLDAEAAWNLATNFNSPCAVIIKHANPCGLAIAPTIDEAYERALQCDPVSAFGGIVALNREFSVSVAERLIDIFTEVVIAPKFTRDAVSLLQTKKNLRIIEAERPVGGHLHMRSIDGGMLVQEVDLIDAVVESWRVVSNIKPTKEQLADAAVAWIACGFVSSNAITLVNGGQTVGIGGGQQNRVDAARLACQRAGERAMGSVAASDAFFPFRDGPDLLATHGVKVIVQPGGSQRDDESIASANEHDMVMIFTGTRHFRH